MAQRISQEIKESIIVDYIDNQMSGEAIARKYNIGATSVRRILKNHNIQTNLYDQRKYKYNQNYFETIDTEEKAYWLGFIAADGSITKNNRTLEIGLTYSDKTHLKKFALAIDYPVENIKNRNTTLNGKVYKSSRICVHSKKICNDLNSLGITEKKWDKVVFPSNIPKNLIRHYLRGYFDGDGSISTAGKTMYGVQKYCISLIATEEFLLQMMNHLEKELNMTQVKLEHRYGIAIWAKGGMKQIRCFLNYIYKDSNIFLDRKHQYYLKLCRSK